MTRAEQWYREFRLQTMHESVTTQDVFMAGFECARQKAADLIENFVEEGDLAPACILAIGMEILPDETV